MNESGGHYAKWNKPGPGRIVCMISPLYGICMEFTWWFPEDGEGRNGEMLVKEYEVSVLQVGLVLEI